MNIPSLEKQTLWQFAILYAAYQMVAIAIIVAWQHMNRAAPISESNIDFIRALSVFVATLWFGLYLFAGPSKVAQYYEQNIGFKNVATKYTIRALDILVHVFPVLLLGLPQSPRSYVLVAIMAAIWYIFTRTYFMLVLQKLPLRIYNMILYMAYPIVIVVCIIASRYLA